MTGFFKFIVQVLSVCGFCFYGKQYQRLFVRSIFRVIRFFELVYSDVCGSMEVRFFGNSSYFVTFIDDFFGFICLYFLYFKDQIYERFLDYVVYAERYILQKFLVL